MAFGACPEPVSLAAVAGELDRAEAAFLAADVEGFHGGVDRAVLSLPCLGEVLAPAVAARLHRARGLDQYVRGDAVSARSSFAAARAVAPELGLSSLLPEGHEALVLFAEADSAGATVRLDPPAEGSLWFDGTSSLDRPADRPTVVQVVARTGALSATRYALPGDPVPAYPVAVVVPTDPPGAPERRRGGRAAWLVVSGVGAATSAVLYGMASASAAEFEGPAPAAWGPADLAVQRDRTNRLVAGSAAAGGVAVVGAVAFAVGSR